MLKQRQPRTGALRRLTIFVRTRVWGSLFVVARRIIENVEWPRERVRQLRERAEQATDENLRARFLHAAAIYEREANIWEMAEAQQVSKHPAPRDLGVVRGSTPGSLATTVKLGRASRALVPCRTLNAATGR